ncbi:MAG TPA: hypothetical protein VF650_02540 [Allosphingosinicella sp.]|jgi:hypothetical protein
MVPDTNFENGAFAPIFDTTLIFQHGFLRKLSLRPQWDRKWCLAPFSQRGGEAPVPPTPGQAENVSEAVDSGSPGV